MQLKMPMNNNPLEGAQFIFIPTIHVIIYHTKKNLKNKINK